jgi:hypothetical protein
MEITETMKVCMARAVDKGHWDHKSEGNHSYVEQIHW